MMGVMAALPRFYLDYEEDQKEERRQVAGSVLIFLTVTAMIISLALVVASKDLSSLILKQSEHAQYFRIVALTLFFDVGATIALTIFRSEKRAVDYIIFSMTRFAVSTGLKVYFVVGLHERAQGVLLGDMIGVAVVYVFLIVFLVNKTKLRFSWSKLRDMLKFGLPLVPYGLAALVMMFADRYFIEYLAPSKEIAETRVAMYVLAYNIGMLMLVAIVQPFDLAWTPFMMDASKEKNAKQTYAHALTYYTLGAGFSCLVLSILAKYVLEVMNRNPDLSGAHIIVPLIAVSYLLYGAFIILNVGIYLEKHTVWTSIIVVVGAIVNVGLCFLLIPDHGVMGAAIATAISYLILPIGVFLASQRYYPIKYEYGRLLKIVLVGTAVYIGATYIHVHSSIAVNTGSIHMIIAPLIIEGVLRAVTVLAYPVILYLLRFHTAEEYEKVRDVLGDVNEKVQDKAGGVNRRLGKKVGRERLIRLRGPWRSRK
jgi:O-antigen/teichoic acid export membrane protein